MDIHGAVLEGGLRIRQAEVPGERIAPALAGLSRDAERTTRLLGLGPWHRISLAGGPGRLEIRSPTIDSLLVVIPPDDIPDPSLAGEADRLAASMRHWLEGLR